jgi:hypothetical protein
LISAFMRWRGFFEKRRLKADIFGYLAVVYAVFILVASGLVPKWGIWYSASPFHREQSLALLHGHLALSKNPCDLDLDLCWSQGGVQQVWGLGVALWRLPFDGMAGLCGEFAFPDRLSLGVFIALTAYVVFLTWFGGKKNAGEGDSTFRATRRWIAIGATFLCLGFAPGLNLLRTRMDHYYEVLAYVMGFGVMLLCGIAAMAKNPSWRRYWVLATLAGVGGLIRPTLIFYGFATLCVAGFLAYRADRKEKAIERTTFAAGDLQKVAIGVLLFIIGGIALFATNMLRFGSGWEFGHHLNVSPALPSVYSTRFDYPFRHASILTSARELFGALFRITSFNDVAFYQQGIFEGQAEIFRARKFNYSTYDLSYFVAVCSAWAFGLCLAFKRVMSPTITTLPSLGSLSDSGGTIIAWSVISSIPLIGLYLKTHAIGDRYMLDFAPAILADIVGLWMFVVRLATASTLQSNIVIAFLLIVLVGWQGYEIASSSGDWGGPQSCAREDAEWATFRQSPPPGELQGRYGSRDDASLTRIPYNGAGWSSDGDTSCCGVFYVKDCHFLQMRLTPAPGYKGKDISIIGISAKVSLESLERESFYWTNGDCVLRFPGPRRTTYRNGLQPAFVAFVPSNYLQKYYVEQSPPSPADQPRSSTRNYLLKYYAEQSPWILKSIEWRK